MASGPVRSGCPPPTMSVGALLGTVLPEQYLLGHFLSNKSTGVPVMTHRPAFC